jgi:hypothetical protein
LASWAKISFETLAYGDAAAGTAPKLGPLFLGCGFAETLTASTSAVYNLSSTDLKSVTIHAIVDGIKQAFVGARGTVNLSMSAKGIPMFKWEFDAAYVDPATYNWSSLVVTRTGWPVDEAVNDKNTTPLTINGVALPFSAFDLTLGNQIKRLSLPGPQVGVEITDRQSSGSCTVMAPAHATFDPFTLAKDGTNIALSVKQGKIISGTSYLQADVRAVISNVSYDQIEDVIAYKLDFDVVPYAGTGNDEIIYSFT